MARKTGSKNSSKPSNGANLGFEAAMWAAADNLRGHMDAADYEHVDLGLIFLKYISDAFEEHHAKLLEDPDVDPEDRDEDIAHNVFRVPKEARWSQLQANAKQPTIGKLIDVAMVAVENHNKTVKGVLPKDYGCPSRAKAIPTASHMVAALRKEGHEIRTTNKIGKRLLLHTRSKAAAESCSGREQANTWKFPMNRAANQPT